MPEWFYIVIIGVMALFIIFWVIVWPILKKRINKKNILRQKEMLKKIKSGTKVILVGGLYGEVIKFDHHLVHILISENTPIVADKNSIIGVVNLKTDSFNEKFIPNKKVKK